MKKILITAGPTREAVDPVRFLSNRSTGKMGYALARSAVARGLSVTLISGPVALSKPSGLEKFIQIETASEMAEAVHAEAPLSDVIVMCAAVADFRPRQMAERKIKKNGEGMILELEPTEDILKWIGGHKTSDQRVVGFAAETDTLEENALGKLRKKNLDWIAANRIGNAGEGFASDTNAVILFGRAGERIVLPLDSKERIASQILETVLKDF